MPGRRDPLAELARRHGILPEYVDAEGRTRTARRESLRAVLRALEVPIDRTSVDPRRTAERPGLPEKPCPAPVFLTTAGRVRAIALEPPRAPRSRAVRVGVVLDGTSRRRPLASAGSGRWTVPADLPVGCYRLVTTPSKTGSDRWLIVAPRRLPPRRGPPRWGFALPVYALRGPGTWGCGDLTALEAFGRWAAGLGATVLATLPLLPAFLERPYDPSPYRPVSQRFWNELYLDVTVTPEFRRSKGLRRRVGSPSFRRRVEALERRPYVAFRTVYRLKREIVERMLREFAHAPAARRAAFRRFVARTPGLTAYARFRASLEPRRRNGARYHAFVQWLVDEQLRGVARRLARRGVVLGLDLPLGVHPDGFDAHHRSNLRARSVDVGSPPDPGVPSGQNWAFPPWRPDRLRAAGYRPLREALRHQLSVAGVLRIDHVLGLHRLFWIPKGRPPRDGVYVRSPVEELYRVVTAEAARAGATIVGEDLGTVPPEVRPTLHRHGLLAVYVAQLEWDGPGRPRPIPKDTVVSVNTHDHAPFAAYWAERTQRPAASSLPGAFPPARTPTAEAFARTTLRLAGSRARILLVNPEDLWGETRPQNVPGRRARRFCRRFRLDLDTLRHRRETCELLCAVDAMRRRRNAR